MAITVTIAGSQKAYRVGSLQLSSPVNGRQTASFEVRSNDGTYRPALDASVVIADGATTLFGGLIDSPEEEGVLGDDSGDYAAISTRINAVSYHAYTERRFVNLTLTAGTLKSMLTTLVSTYLTGYGVTLDAGQVDGPTLPELTYTYTRLMDVLDELMTLTGTYGNPYVWTINGSKVLSAYQPSTTAAPFNITDGDGNRIGDLTVDRTRHDYANTIILIVPTKTEVNHVETFTGDGTTYSFPLSYTLTGMRYTVQVDGVDELLTFQGIGFDLAVHWLYYAADNTIRRMISGTPDPPALGAVISITFDGTYSGQGIASDAGEIAANGIWERVITVDSVPADTTAQALADGYLAKAIASPKAITYRTFRSGLAVGQSQTITCATRNLSALACIITEIKTSDYGTGSGRGGLLYDVTVTSGVNPQDQWRDIYRLWAGDKTGNSMKATFSVGAGDATGKVGPAPPDQSVQFNNGGSFGGDEAFIYYKDQNSVVCGGGASSITAADFESCQVFGYDNHITG